MVHLSRRVLLVITILFLVASSAASSFRVNAFPSGGSYPPTYKLVGGDWYDSWGVDRNYYGGVNGYMPNLAYETLGANRELAYSIGETFKTSYTDESQRAEAILKFVQRWTEYGYDSDNVVMNGVPQDEWAWNADEMAHMFNKTTNTVAVGDCEDMAFLCATLYTAAGFDVAMVLAPEHVALLIWLPDYPNANYYWDIPGDGRGAGWIWVEATGEQNPLGWTPPDFASGDFDVYPLGLMAISVSYSPQEPQAQDDVTITASVVSANASVSQVLLNYSTNGIAQETLTMALEGSSYSAIIPKQPKGTVVELSVSVTDSEGNVRESDQSSYTVGASIGRCVIATATYGSELAPQVQLLRDFRDSIAMNTFAGSSFMTVFNSWYYSWSPPVAATIAPNNSLRGIMMVVLQPILYILQASTATFSSLSFNGEFAIVMTGLVAASLIGLIYLMPVVTLVFLGIKRFGRNLALPSATKALRFVIIPWIVSIALIVIAEIVLSSALMMIATAAFVILTIVLTVGTTSLWLASLYKSA